MKEIFRNVKTFSVSRNAAVRKLERNKWKIEWVRMSDCNGMVVLQSAIGFARR